MTRLDALAVGYDGCGYAMGWSAVSTVAALIICPAVCALTTLAFPFDVTCSAATANSAGPGK